MSARRAALLPALLVLASCGGGSSTPAAKAGDSTTPPAAPQPAASPAAPVAPAAAPTEAELTALDELPTTEQLEQKLDQSVTEQNADAEFEKLQQEIEKDDAGG